MLLRVKYTLNEFLHPFIVRPLPVNLTTLDTAMKFIYYLLDLGWQLVDNGFLRDW